MEKQIQNTECPLLVGVDVGSTTTKIVAVDRMTGQIVYSDYQRHGATQLKSVARALKLLMLRFPKARVRLALTGSGAKGVAEQLGACYIQEVVANSIALRRRYAHVRTAIELGGQDAKIIFFHRDENTGNLNVSDMRMNGSCAGGTGAFLDEIAALLKVPMEEFDDLARAGGAGRGGAPGKLRRGAGLTPLSERRAGQPRPAGNVYRPGRPRADGGQHPRG